MEDLPTELLYLQELWRNRQDQTGLGSHPNTAGCCSLTDRYPARVEPSQGHPTCVLIENLPNLPIKKAANN